MSQLYSLDIFGQIIDTFHISNDGGTYHFQFHLRGLFSSFVEICRSIVLQRVIRDISIGKKVFQRLNNWESHF